MLPGVVAPPGTDVGVLGMLLPVGTLVSLGTESLGLPLELGMASLPAGVVVDDGVVASVALGFFLLFVIGFFLVLVVGALVVSLGAGVAVLGVVVLGVVELGVDCISPPAGVVVEEGVVVSVALGFFSMLLAGFFLLPEVLLFVFFLVVWVVVTATVET